MVFFDRTSTQMLSMIGAVYGVFIYSISFSLEMWFIVTAPVLPAATSSSSSNQFNPMDSRRRGEEDGQEEAIASVPLLAFVLAALYFVTVMVSLLLILGIIIRSMMCVLTWIITIVLLLLPEVSLVLFMTVYTWGIENRNGQIELCFYVIRGIMNIFFVICVQNLISNWKSEKQASKFAYNLNTYNSYPSSGTNTTTINGTPAYIEGGCSTTVNPVFKYGSLHRGSQFDPSRTFNGYGSSYDDEEDEVEHHEQIYDRDGYLQSHRVSKYTTQSLDRRKFRNNKTQSMLNGHAPTTATLNYANSFSNGGKVKQRPVKDRDRDEEVILRPLSSRPFDYLTRPGSVVDVRNSETDHYHDHHHPNHQSRDYHHHITQYNPHQQFSHSPVVSMISSNGLPSRQQSFVTSRTLPRNLERGSIQNIRDFAL